MTHQFFDMGTSVAWNPHGVVIASPAPFHRIGFILFKSWCACISQLEQDTSLKMIGTNFPDILS